MLEVGWLFIAVLAVVIVLVFRLVSRHRTRSRTDSDQRAAGEVVRRPRQSMRPAPVQTVFVSYRRDDSADVTGRIYDRLCARFGADRVFKDVDSIPLGRDFREIIGDAVAKASVVVVVIGRRWLGPASAEGRTRVHEQNDFVRTEVAAALQQGKPVIPVLVGQADMPAEADLPDDIKGITYRHGIKVRPDPDFTHDVERLIRGIEQAAAA